MKRLKEEEQEQKKRDKENESLIRQAEKRLTKNKSRVSSSQIEDDVFSDQGTPILGKDRLILQKKISQYKALFADELKGFKVKKNSSPIELQASLEEMETIVQVGTVDDFITDSVLQCIKIVEGITSLTRNYNVSGLSEILKSNPQFHKLMKTLYIKYNTFAEIPAEYQLILIILTSSYICMQKNRQKEKINSFLNEPIPIQETKK